MSGPSVQIVGPGTPVTLGMQMSATEPLTYQWMNNGVVIPGATNATLILPGMSMANAGQYMVTARNSVGTVANSSAAVSLFGMVMTNGTPQLTVAAPVGSHFRIDYSDMVGSGEIWQSLTNFTMMGSLSQMSDTLPQGLHARFYRAMMIPR